VDEIAPVPDSGALSNTHSAATGVLLPGCPFDIPVGIHNNEQDLYQKRLKRALPTETKLESGTSRSTSRTFIVSGNS
jgi:hypothetical protein